MLPPTGSRPGSEECFGPVQSPSDDFLAPYGREQQGFDHCAVRLDTHRGSGSAKETVRTVAPCMSTNREDLSRWEKEPGRVDIVATTSFAVSPTKSVPPCDQERFPWRAMTIQLALSSLPLPVAILAAGWISPARTAATAIKKSCDH